MEKANVIFSQERDPRFAEMFAGVSACKFPNSAYVPRVWGVWPPSGHQGAAIPRERVCMSAEYRSPNGTPRLLALPLVHLPPGALDPSSAEFEGWE